MDDLVQDGVFASVKNLDIKAEWLLDPDLGGRDFLFESSRLTVVLYNDGADDTAPDLFAFASGLLGDRAKVLDLKRLSSVGNKADSQQDRYLPGEYIVSQLDESYVEEIFAAKPNPLIAIFEELNKQYPDIAIQITSAVTTDVRVQEKPESKPESVGEGVSSQPVVVMGIIDDGIRFAHERFRNRCGSRVEYFWDQTTSQENTAAIEAALNDQQRVLYGNEITRHNINQFIEEFSIEKSAVAEPREGSAGKKELLAAVDEAALYRKYFPRSYRENAITHGTHVLDIAAGASIEDDVTDRPIIAVQLPSRVTEDTSGTFLEHHLRAGIMYIVDKASALGDNVPIVINFSFGTFAGPHDGTSDLEKDIDSLLYRRKNTHLVLPAGNSHLTQCHARFTADDEPVNKVLHWRIQPDDYTTSWLHIWVPEREEGKSHVPEIVIVPPSATGSVETPYVLKQDQEGKTLRVTDGKGQIIAMVNQKTNAEWQRTQFCIAVHPTARHDQNGTVAPAGLWKITLRNVSLVDDEVVDAWIERDDTAYGYRRRGRQSYFEDDNYQVYNENGFLVVDDDDNKSPVKRRGMLNALATGDRTLVVGAAHGSSDSSEFEPADYTAMNGNEAKPLPHFLCVSDDSRIHAGTLAARALSGARVALTGTSVAAPQAARLLADEIIRRAVEQPVGDQHGVASDKAEGIHSVDYLADKLNRQPTQRQTGAGEARDQRMSAGVLEWEGRAKRFPELREKSRGDYQT